MKRSTERQEGGLGSVTVADADAHITETFEEVVTYIDDEYTDVQRVCDAASLPLNDIMSLSRATPSQPFNERQTGSEILTEEMDVDAKLQSMDEIGVDYGIITPTLSLLLPSVNRPRYAVALANAYNRYILDRFAVDDERLRVALTVAPQKPARAAEEIDRFGDHDDVAGVQLAATGLVPPPGDEHYDPIYRAARDNDLPVLFHSGGNTSQLLPVIARTANTYAEEHAVNHPFSHMWNLATMMYRGVPERFPDLEFVFQEAGIGYIPYFTWRLDDHYLERGYEIPYLDKLPSEYIADQFYFSTQPLGLTETPGQRNAGRYIASVVEMVGPGQLMFSTDLPHPDFDTPSELYDRISGALDPDEVRAVMGQNAIDVFGF
jgi:predicted TIM-barrel fold metal-dependent hydrolase